MWFDSETQPQAVHHTQPDIAKSIAKSKSKQGSLKRLQSEVNNCKMVALINPAGRVPMPTQLSRQWSRRNQAEDEELSDVPEQVEASQP